MKSERNSLRNRQTFGSISQQDPTINSYSLHDSGSRTAKSKQQKLSLFDEFQKNVLDAYFEKDPMWTKDTVSEVTELLRLPRRKIQKWGYDK